LDAFAECAGANVNIGGQLLVHLCAVIGAVAKQEDVRVDQTTGLVMGVDPGEIDRPATAEHNGHDGVAQLGVSLRRRGVRARDHGEVGTLWVCLISVPKSRRKPVISHRIQGACSLERFRADGGAVKP
jgi:hypothetical protein